MAAAVRTLPVVALIGVLSTAFGWPIGVVLARMNDGGLGQSGLVQNRLVRNGLARSGFLRSLFVSALLLPLLMPGYLAYAGWGMLLDPSMWLGDQIAQQAEAGARWLPGFMKQTCAVFGLALFASPVSGIILAASRRRAGAGVDALTRLDLASPRRRFLLSLSAHRWAVLTAIVAVMLLMLGSSIPLHLAQIRTHAIVLWSELSLAGPDEMPGVWLGAWPLVGLAIGAGYWISGACMTTRVDDRSNRAHAGVHRRDRLVVCACIGVFVLAIGGPVGLFVWDLGPGLWPELREFWRTTHGGLLSSVWIALWVGVGGVVLSGLTAASVTSVTSWTSAAAGSRGARVSRLCARLALWVMCSAALLPGVLIGTAVGRAWSGIGTVLGWHFVVDSGAAVGLAHLVRFGFVSILTGLVAARAEPDGVSDLRRLDGAVGLAGWWRTGFGMHWPVIAGGGLAVAAMSLHEVESAVMLQPPGPGALSLRMLELLHYARREALSAGAISIFAIGGVLAIGAVSLWGGAGLGGAGLRSKNRQSL